MRTILSVIIICVILTVPVPFYADGAGTAGAPFLSIPVGARSIGLGGSFVGLADDAEGVYYNPAALAFFSRQNILLHHDSRFFDNQFNYFAYNTPLHEKHGIGVNFTVQDAGSFEGYDAANRKTGSFNARDYALGVGYGYRINNELGVGAAVKLINSQIASYDAQAIALDAGILYRPHEKVSLGASLRNLGTGIQFVNQKDALPLNFQGGVCFTPIRNLNIVADANKAIDDESVRVHLGTEYWLMGRYGFRLGYQNGSELGGDFDGLSAGFGVRFPIEEISSRTRREFFAGAPALNYAYLPQGDFGESHLLSLSFAFGQTRGAPRAQKKTDELKASSPEEIQNRDASPARRDRFSGRTLAILDFRNTLQQDSYEWLRKALREIIVSKLRATFTVLDREKVREVAELIDLAGIPLQSDADFIQFGKFLKVDGLVAGAFAVQDDKIFLEVGIYDSKAGMTRDSFTVIEKVADVLKIGESLTERIERSFK